jgi:hypothetical protein
MARSFLFSIGSATNVSVEPDLKRAAISVYDPEGKNPPAILQAA